MSISNYSTDLKKDEILSRFNQILDSLGSYVFKSGKTELYIEHIIQWCINGKNVKSASNPRDLKFLNNILKSRLKQNVKPDDMIIRRIFTSFSIYSKIMIDKMTHDKDDIIMLYAVTKINQDTTLRSILLNAGFNEKFFESQGIEIDNYEEEKPDSLDNLLIELFSGDEMSHIIHSDSIETFSDKTEKDYNSMTKEEKISYTRKKKYGSIQYCIDMNTLVDEKNEVPAMNRDKEIAEIEKTLLRKNKANVVLTGDPGVGKTKIVETFANKINKSKSNYPFHNYRIFKLDTISLEAGLVTPGQLAERVKKIITGLKTCENAILFIDEIHNICSVDFSKLFISDLGNMLKPELARGELKIIGATTDNEYRVSMERDKALDRRFNKIDVKEPSIEDTKAILRQSKKDYERFFNNEIEDDALDKIVDVASKYNVRKKFPDKAFDVLESVFARKKSKQNNTPVTVDDVLVEAANMYNLPIEDVKCSDNEKLKNAKDKIEQVVFGQNDAIEKILNVISVSKAGLREDNKTVCNILLRGKTGTGKTLIAKELAKALGVDLVRFDMSEYSEKHTIAKLIGSPPGYLGYRDGDSGSGVLINEIDKHPSCVLLLDEIEKAHPNLYNLFLQVMDEGTLSSQSNKKVSFKNVILIMTSNVGAADTKKSGLGFNESAEEYNAEVIDRAMKRTFTPEFVNRLDEIITVKDLADDDYMRIISLETDRLNDTLKDKKIKITLNKEVQDFIMNKIKNSENSGRFLKNMFQKEIKVPLSKEILFNGLKNSNIKLRLDNERICW